MAELTDPRTDETATTSTCCAPEQQATCCEPSEKAGCCSSESSTCGCLAAQGNRPRTFGSDSSGPKKSGSRTLATVVGRAELTGTERRDDARLVAVDHRDVVAVDAQGARDVDADLTAPITIALIVARPPEVARRRAQTFWRRGGSSSRPRR